MEVPNQAAKGISGKGKKALYDASCKRLLSIKIILAHILKSCLDEFKDYEPYDIAEKYIEGEPQISEVAVHQDEAEVITGMNTESSSVNEGTVRYDILFYAYVPVLDETVKLIINVEAQVDFNQGYSLLKRAVYYCSRLISSQYATEFGDKSYDGIKKVFSIWICPMPPADKRNTITRFSLTEENFVGNAKYNFKEYDLMEIVMVCLGGKQGSENYDGIIKFLDVLTSKGYSDNEKREILKNEYNIKITKEIESEVLGMCNLSDGIWNDAWNKASAVTEEKTKLTDIRNIMETLKVTLNQALDALKIPEDEREKYKEMLNN